MAALINLFRDASWMTSERVQRLGLGAMLTVLAVFGLNSLLYISHGLVMPSGEQLGRDFVNYWAGSRLALHGQAPLAYDLGRFADYEHQFAGPTARWYGYPPVAMLLGLPFALVPFVPAWLLWTGMGALLVAWVLSDEIGWGWGLVAAIASPAFLQSAIAGQNGAFSAALLAGGVLLLDKRPKLAGLLWGMSCFKPQLALLLPIALIAARRWQSFVSAALTVLGLVIASGVFLGWQTWTAFLRDLPIHGALLAGRYGMWPRMPSVYLMARWLGASSTLAYVAQFLSGAMAAILVWMMWRRPVSFKLRGAVVMIGAFLATPYAWDYDMVMLSIAAVWLWADASRTGWRPWEKTALLLLVAGPLVTPILAYSMHLQLGPAILWLAIWLAAVRICASAPIQQSICGTVDFQNDRLPSNAA
jgi:arabinofuranan 3-O-arabinosyltransferase